MHVSVLGESFANRSALNQGQINYGEKKTQHFIETLAFDIEFHGAQIYENEGCVQTIIERRSYLIIFKVAH